MLLPAAPSALPEIGITDRYAGSSDYTREALFVLIEQQKGMQRILEEWGPCSQIAQKGELTCVVSLRGVCVLGSGQLKGM